MEILRSFFKPVYELLLLIVMPFRILLLIATFLLLLQYFYTRKRYWFVHVVTKISYFLIFNGIKLLLLPELFLVRRIRKRGEKIPGIIYFLENIFEAIIVFLLMASNKSKVLMEEEKAKSYPFKFRWISLILGLSLCLWYFRPLLGTSDIGKFLDSTFVSWNSFERWILTGKFKSISSTPKKAVENYFSDINNRNIDKAWNRTSTKFQNNRKLMSGGYSEYKDWWGKQVTKAKINSISVKNHNFDAATVEVNLQYLYAKNSKLSKNETITLVLILDNTSGTWIIDDSIKRS